MVYLRVFFKLLVFSCKDAALEVPFELVTQSKLTVSVIKLKIENHCDRTMILLTILLWKVQGRFLNVFEVKI